MAVPDDKPVFTIGVAARLLGVHPRTIRIYEEEGLIKPVRDRNHRLFSRNDIEWIRCLRNLIHEEGISIPGIKRLLALTPCWEIRQCSPETKEKCSAFIDRALPCWERAGTACAKEFTECGKCSVYIKAMEAMREAEAGPENNRGKPPTR